jgi:hypothetical protein
MTLGFEKPLYILPFDHRGSFQTNLFGWKGTLSPAQTAEIAAVTGNGRTFSRRPELSKEGAVVVKRLQIARARVVN